MKKLVIASNNAGKLREIRALLAPLGCEVLTQAALGIAEAEEPHPTFIENALAKARHVARRSGLPALADDSGICVVALAGEPGVHSARYAGAPKSDQRNNQKLVNELARAGDRRAYYYCAMVLVRHATDPQPLIGEGCWWGEVIGEPRGALGFGYDPHFLLPELGKTAGELEPDQKNRISHRGQALAALVAKLRLFP